MPAIATRLDAIASRNKKLLGAPDLTTSSKKQVCGSLKSSSFGFVLEMFFVCRWTQTPSALEDQKPQDQELVPKTLPHTKR